MLTYRQKWTPETYQVGELVATIPGNAPVAVELRVAAAA
jgi:hypothetical protein